MLEVLAEQMHVIWANWMNYLFSKCVKNSDGSYTIPPGHVDRWKRQASTTYTNLSKTEKDSDRVIAEHIRKVLHKYLLGF